MSAALLTAALIAATGSGEALPAAASGGTSEHRPAATAAAFEPDTTDLAPHWVASGAMLLVVGLGQGAINAALPGGRACPQTADGLCDPASLRGLDRASLGNHSAAWRAASDAGNVAALALPVAAGLAEGLAAGASGWGAAYGVDLTVTLEAVAAAAFVNQTWKYAVRRPRPGLYRPGSATVEGALSFPSGHTALTAAATTAWATTFAFRHPTSPWRWAAAGGAVLLTGVTGAGRILGGMHFATDVIAGAAVGGAMGLCVPWAHRHHLRPVAAPPGSAGAGLAGTF